MTNFEQEIRRLPNGAIDIAFYHRQASVLRSHAMAGFYKGLGPAMKPLIAFYALALVLFAVAI